MVLKPEQTNFGSAGKGSVRSKNGKFHSPSSPKGRAVMAARR